jgi:enoyl-[acyl-carrier protein] reductase I
MIGQGPAIGHRNPRPPRRFFAQRALGAFALAPLFPCAAGAQPLNGARGDSGSAGIPVGARLRGPWFLRRSTNKKARKSMAQDGSTPNASPLSGILAGKKGLVLGVATNRSIAWGIAKAAADAGAEIALTYQIDQLEKRVRPMAEEIGAHVVGRCDVTEEASVDAVFAEVEKLWGKLDFLVHCLAFSDRDQLTGRYVDTTLANFNQSLAISCYSFTALAQRAEKLMEGGGSLLTLTYYGAEKWMPHYNVMGVAKAALEASVRYLAADLGVKNIRVNAISAGPIKTAAASGIGDFRYILRWNEYNAPLRRVVTIEEVGETAVYLLSPMARGVSGEVLHVDAGYHVVGMMNPAAAPKMADLLKLLPQQE